MALRPRSKAPAGAIALALLLAVAAPVAAQQAPVLPLPGGLYPLPPVLVPPGGLVPLPGLEAPPEPPDTREFVLRASGLLDGSYTDNFFRSSTQRQAEYRQTLTPTVDLHWRPSRSDVRAVYSPTVVHSSLTESESDLRLFHLLNATGTIALSDRFTLTASDAFVRTDEPGVTDPSGVRRGITLLTSEVFAVGLTYAQDRWSLTPKYSLTFNDNETEATSATSGTGATGASGSTVERGFIQTIGLDGKRNLSERNVLGASYEYTVADFQVAQDFVSHFGRLTFARDIGPRLDGRADVSVTERTFADSSVFKIYRGGVEARWNPLEYYVLLARVGYVHGDFGRNHGDDAEYSIVSTYAGSWVQLALLSSRTLKDTSTEGVNGGFIKTTDYAAKLRFLPSARLTVELGGRYEEATFVETIGSTISPTGTTTSTGPRRQDKTTEATLDAGYSLTRMVSVVAGYTYTHTTSNQPAFGYSANRVHLGLLIRYE